MKNKSEPTWDEIGSSIGRKIERECKDEDYKCKPKVCGPGCGSAVYGLGVLGALFYYLTTATDLWMGVIGVVKAFLWPAFLVFELLKFLGA